MSQAISTWPIKAVLFDLDGTLVDTAPDLAAALNAVLRSHQQAELNYLEIRPVVSNGADALIKLAFGEALTTTKQLNLKNELIEHYQQNIAQHSVLFDGLEDALVHLESKKIPWGIVTNKPEHLTLPLLKQMSLTSRAGCIVCGDQVKNPKPHPEPIYLACQQLSVAPEHSIYIGDAERDIRAGRLAGLKTIACEFGYIPASSDINTWRADLVIDSSINLSNALKSLN